MRSTIIETNDTGDQKQPLDLKDIIELHLHDGTKLQFEVVGLVADDENNTYAVCYNDQNDEFIVTDQFGDLLEEEELAQEILDDFFVLAEEATPEQIV